MAFPTDFEIWKKAYYTLDSSDRDILQQLSYCIGLALMRNEHEILEKASELRDLYWDAHGITQAA